LWAVRFKHSGPDIFMRPDRKLLTRRGNDLFFIDPSGTVSKGPALEVAGHNMAVDPRSGAMYFGGSYRSGTGLEPYVNPYLYKLDADGEIEWTGYGWSGPIVGVEQHRLVSDSSINNISIAEDGSLSLIGWSDGGNTVLSYQPYDLRKPVRKSGFASSTWGATGGLTVRIANIIHMDAETMDVDHATQYVAYLPTSDVPTLLNVYSVHRLPNGDIAVTGAANTGFIETWDAWCESWYIQYRRNEFAQAKNGTFFTLFRPDFSLPRMSTRTPGAAGPRLVGKGDKLLLFGGGTDHEQAIVKNAIQPTNGGGLDGYAMLIDTQAEPHPPVIPEWTWGDRNRKKGRR
jgi:hypothetical protein